MYTWNTKKLSLIAKIARHGNKQAMEYMRAPALIKEGAIAPIASFKLQKMDTISSNLSPPILTACYDTTLISEKFLP